LGVVPMVFTIIKRFAAVQKLTEKPGFGQAIIAFIYRKDSSLCHSRFVYRQ